MINLEIIYKNAVKEYNNIKVLDIENLVIREGKVISILGCNGSGKSTLMKCTDGIEKLTSGYINYDDSNKMEDRLNRISILNQNPYLFNETVEKNIIKGLLFRKMDKNEISNRFNKYSDYFDIDHLMKKNAKLLSGGESSKVALLRTAILEPEITLLDEPTASMDVESTLNAEKLITDMKTRIRTVIVITHDIFQAERISDEIIFMDKGKVIESGQKDAVLKYPKHKLVKRILNKL